MWRVAAYLTCVVLMLVSVSSVLGSEWEPAGTADLDTDGDVDLSDLSILASQWLTSGDYTGSNALVISPADDISAKYNWLKSPDRNTTMGTLSATNRRALILSPGVYTITTTLTFDTSYVDITELSKNPEDAIITMDGGGSTVTQTADTIALSFFTIRNTGLASNDHGFNLNASDNSDSTYYFMHFRQPNADDYENGNPNTLFPVWGTQDIGGTWIRCKADDYGWRCAANTNLSATMYDCIGGYRSFGGDQSGVEITGTLIGCRAGRQSFGGCGKVGCDISGTLIDCEAGDASFAMGKTFSGVAIRCRCVSMGGMVGQNGFAGYSPRYEDYGTFSGYAYECTTEGGNSFGMGNANCTQTGRVINCRNGTPGEYAAGRINSAASTVINNGASATLTTFLPGENNDLVFTSKHPGVRGNSTKIKYDNTTPVGAVTVSASWFIAVNVEAGVTTANEVKGYIEEDPVANAHVSIANAGEDTGEGAVTTMNWTYLTGGVDALCFKGNHPWVPTDCTADTAVYAFDNGHTYTNGGAYEPVTFFLPAALAGMQYTFVRKEKGNGKDIYVAPQPDEDITLTDNTTLPAGFSRGNEDNAYGLITVECFDAGHWVVTKEIGTWINE